MQIQNSFIPVLPAFLRSGAIQFSQNRDMFHDIFQRTLNSKSASRPPKIELTGFLVSCNKIVQGYQCYFKLETDSNEFFLSMSDAMTQVAKMIKWEEVTVKGFLDPDNGLFEVEKIRLAQRSEPFLLTVGSMDSYFDLDQFKRTIIQRGKLDLAPEYLAV
ncbi:MAG: hypothetical protein JNM39_12910 [Bdellovibrionaceae bacterium]|nr:hypothetical protein [Pseudobdellovibrionaceae bacterium]